MRRLILGFSLVEAVIAIGIVAFAILAVIALMPVGIKNTQDSNQENQAMNLISMIASDIRNTPITNSTSRLLGLSPLPWCLNASDSKVIPNPAVSPGTERTFYASADQRASTVETSESTHRITVKYVRVPGLQSLVPGDAPPITGLAPVELLVTVSWPPSVSPNANSSSPRGSVDVYLTCPKP